MIILVVLLYSLPIISCFVLMPETNKKGGWVKRLKFLFLITVILLPLASCFCQRYFCSVITFLMVVSAFTVVSHVSYKKLNKQKKMLTLVVYLALFIRISILITQQLMMLLV